MEILTTGEKIKRARIYKGLTLKDICGEKLSVSKLSCIENDKIKIEPELIEYISEKLGIDYEYLIEGARVQVKKNLEKLKTIKSLKEYEDGLKYNLSYALDNEFYDIAFDISHLLFRYYLDEDMHKQLQEMASQYFDIYNKAAMASNLVIYLNDMGRYLSIKEEYEQAIAYYNNGKMYLDENKCSDAEILAEIIYNQINCYIMIGRFDEIFKAADKLENLLCNLSEGNLKISIYKILCIIFSDKDNIKFKYYMEKVYSSYGSRVKEKYKFMFEIAVYMFKRGICAEAVKYIIDGIEQFPSDDKDEKVGYLINCIKVLVDYNELDLAQSICDDALNLSIILDNVKYIEKTYYYKSMILQKKNDYVSAEMYMNLSTDALMKYGNKNQRYERYLEMGNMYHKLGQVSDSIKYFSLAMFLEKKL